MKRLAFNDTETYSEAPLKHVGAAKYFEHPSTETLILTYQLDPLIGTEVWDRTLDKSIPQDLLDAAANPSIPFVAFNAAFDMQAFENAGISVPLERWRCLMVASLALGLQGGLDDVLERAGIPHQKSREGKRLIHKFCKPQPKNHIVRRWTRLNAPEDWAKFIHYGIVDTDILVPLYEYLTEYGSVVNWDEWHIDQIINMRGLPVDKVLVDKALSLADEEKEALLARMIEISGIDNPNSKPQLKVWLRNNGLNIANMQKATVALALTNPSLSPEVKEMLRLNQQLSMTSTSKWDTLNRAMCDDHRIRYTHQYLGAARTGRDAHRLFQPGNLPRGSLDDAPSAANFLLWASREEVDMVYGNVMDVLSSTIRCGITAPEGEILVVADLAGIEGRTLPWQCGFTQKVDKIREGLDMYKVAAEGIYHVEYENVNKAQRFGGKVAELALGYQGGVNALHTMGAVYGATFKDTEAIDIVTAWRRANKPIKTYWAACEKAVKTAIQHPGGKVDVHHLQFAVVGDFLMITLPSGRKLAYMHPKYDHNGFSYMGLNGYTNKWERIDSYGGKIVENVNQAIARDVFFHGLTLFENHGGRVVLRVHDELVASVPENEARHWENLLLNCMEEVPAWATGLPLKAEGFITKRYRK